VNLVAQKQLKRVSVELQAKLVAGKQLNDEFEGLGGLVEGISCFYAIKGGCLE
jgi:hypothetical protein